MQYFHSYGYSYVKRGHRSYVALIWRHGRPIVCCLPQPNRTLAAFEATCLIRELPRI